MAGGAGTGAFGWAGAWPGGLGNVGTWAAALAARRAARGSRTSSRKARKRKGSTASSDPIGWVRPASEPGLPRTWRRRASRAGSLSPPGRAAPLPGRHSTKPRGGRWAWPRGSTRRRSPPSWRCAPRLATAAEDLKSARAVPRFGHAPPRPRQAGSAPPPQIRVAARIGLAPRRHGCALSRSQWSAGGSR